MWILMKKSYDHGVNRVKKEGRLEARQIQKQTSVKSLPCCVMDETREPPSTSVFLLCKMGVRVIPTSQVLVEPTQVYEVKGLAQDLG